MHISSLNWSDLLDWWASSSWSDEVASVVCPLCFLSLSSSITCRFSHCSVWIQVRISFFGISFFTFNFIPCSEDTCILSLFQSKSLFKHFLHWYLRSGYWRFVFAAVTILTGCCVCPLLSMVSPRTLPSLHCTQLLTSSPFNNMPCFEDTCFFNVFHLKSPCKHCLHWYRRLVFAAVSLLTGCCIWPLPPTVSFKSLPYLFAVVSLLTGCCILRTLPPMISSRSLSSLHWTFSINEVMKHSGTFSSPSDMHISSLNWSDLLDWWASSSWSDEVASVVCPLCFLSLSSSITCRFSHCSVWIQVRISFFGISFFTFNFIPCSEDTCILSLFQSKSLFKHFLHWYWRFVFVASRRLVCATELSNLSEPSVSSDQGFIANTWHKSSTPREKYSKSDFSTTSLK